MASSLVVVQQRTEKRFSEINAIEVLDSKGEDMTDYYPRLKDGKSLKTAQARVVLRKRDNKPISDFLNNMYLLPIVNSHVLMALAEEGIANVELYPVDLFDGAGKPIKHDYQLLNVLGRYPIIDWERSQWEWSVPDDPMSFKVLKRVVLDERVTPSERLFWMDDPHELVASGELAERFLSGEFSGTRVTYVFEFKE